MALFAPIPMASESTATTVKPRDFASTRSPCLMSFRQLSSETVRSGMTYLATLMVRVNVLVR
jgi:hypothetical protein